MKSQILFCFLVGILLANAIKFEIVANQERCLRQQYRPDTLVKGTVHVAPAANDLTLAVKVILYIFKVGLGWGCSKTSFRRKN